MISKLTEILTENELDVAIKNTTEVPTYLLVHTCLKHHRYGTFPGCLFKSYVVEVNGSEKVYFCVKISKHPGFRNFLFISGNSGIKMEKELMFEILDEIKAAHPNVLDVNGPVVVCASPFSDFVNAWFEERMFHLGYDLSVKPCHTYYMNSEQQEKLLSECKNGIEIHQDYYWDDASPENDAGTFVDTWPYAKHGDFENTQDKLTYMPSSMIRDKRTKKAASFEMTDGSGFLNHLFTFPEHRQKGLAKAVERDLSVKLINRGMVPYKTVVVGNCEVIRSSDKDPIFTKWVDGNGKPIFITFLNIIKKEE